MGFFTIISILSSVAQAAGQIFQGINAQNVAESNAKAAKATAAFNARQAENDAIRIRNRGVEAERKQRRENAELLSRQRAQIGASGVEVESGSALALQDDTVSLGEIEVRKTRDFFQQEAAASDTRSELIRIEGNNRANQFKSQGENAFNAGLIGAGTTAVGAASSFFGDVKPGESASGIIDDNDYFNDDFFNNRTAGKKASASFFGGSQFSSKWNY